MGDGGNCNFPLGSLYVLIRLINGGICDCIIRGDGYEPSMNGSVIYLICGDDLNIPYSKVMHSGGKIILPKTAIGSDGFMAHFADTEGNKLAFSSMK